MLIILRAYFSKVFTIFQRNTFIESSRAEVQTPSKHLKREKLTLEHIGLKKLHESCKIIASLFSFILNTKKKHISLVTALTVRYI